MLAQGLESDPALLTVLPQQVDTVVPVWSAVSTATMDAFLQTVQGVPANVAALVAGLIDGGYTDPAHLNMAEANEVLSVFPTEGEGKLSPPDKSFLRRAVALASAPPTPPPVPAGAGASQPEMPAPVPRSDRLQDLYGVETTTRRSSSCCRRPLPPR